MAYVDLSELIQGIASRSATRSEAQLAADIRMLILHGGLDLEDSQVVAMEVPTADGTQRRIDIEAGLTVIEVKKDLRIGNIREEGRTQLRGYVETRTKLLGQRYVGVLTDGAEWLLHFLGPDGVFREVSTFAVDLKEPDHESLIIWLDGALATQGQLVPTASEVERRLGSDSPGYQLDFANLAVLYQECGDRSEVEVKRDLWAQLLTTASGASFTNTDDLFVNHTYLVLVASLIAHAVVGLPITTTAPAALVRGLNFGTAGLHNVVEADFFDWLLEVNGGAEFVTGLARRLARFEWSEVPHDVLKALYQSVISAEQRHTLGEYYTPDWLASAMVDELVGDPLATRVLDPGCGSGTFLFWCVRRYLDAADDSGMSNADALDGLVESVYGADVHPVAVALARVTYLLAIGSDRLKKGRGSISIPVYLGDSLQWGQRHGELSNGALRIPISESGTFWSQELVFPEAVVEDATRFDRLVADMADRASKSDPTRPKAIEAIMKKHGVSGDEATTIRATYQTMCDLQDSGRNHIWGYYVRNLVRPVWLSLAANRVDVLVGNPPWLAYRYMTDQMQTEFREQSKSRNLWTGGQMATHQELAAYFVVRCMELYLQVGGRFGFVMPNAALSREQYQGFRSGRFASTSVSQLTASFEAAWDLDKIRPSPFPVPSATVFGMKTQEDAHPLRTDEVQVWEGKLLDENALWANVAELITVSQADPESQFQYAGESEYKGRFFQGATITPRSLVCVEVLPTPALGLPEGMISVRSARSTQEKMPWKELHSLEGTIESAFIRNLMLGSTIAPFRVLDPWRAVIPWDGTNVLDADDSGLEQFAGLAEWWRTASERWSNNRQKKSPPTLTGRINFQKALETQFGSTGSRVVYTTSGSSLVAALVEDASCVIDSSLYWATVSQSGEAHYLLCILNSSAMEKAVAPLQSKGNFGRRHFHKFVFDVPFPLYNGNNALHQQISQIGSDAALEAAKVEIPAGTEFKKARRLVNAHLAKVGITSKQEAAVATLLKTL